MPPAVHRGRDLPRKRFAAVAARLQRRGVRERDLPFRRGAVGAAHRYARKSAAVDRVRHLHPPRHREVAAEVKKIGVAHDEHRTPRPLVAHRRVDAGLPEDALSSDRIRRAASVRRGGQSVAGGVGNVAIRLGHVPYADIVRGPRANRLDFVRRRAAVVHRERRRLRERRNLDPDERRAVRVPLLDIVVERLSVRIGEPELASARRIGHVRIAEPRRRIRGESNCHREVRKGRLTRIARRRERDAAREEIRLHIPRHDNDRLAGLAFAYASQHRHSDRRVEVSLFACRRLVGCGERCAEQRVVVRHVYREARRKRFDAGAGGILLDRRIRRERRKAALENHLGKFAAAHSCVGGSLLERRELRARDLDGGMHRIYLLVGVPRRLGVRHLPVVQPQRAEKRPRHDSVACGRHMDAVDRRLVVELVFEVGRRGAVLPVHDRLPRVAEGDVVCRRVSAHRFCVCARHLSVLRVELSERRRHYDRRYPGGLRHLHHRLYVFGAARRRLVGQRHVVNAGANRHDGGMTVDDIVLKTRSHLRGLLARNAASDPVDLDSVRGKSLHRQPHVAVRTLDAVVGDRIAHEDDPVAVFDQHATARGKRGRSQQSQHKGLDFHGGHQQAEPRVLDFGFHLLAGFYLVAKHANIIQKKAML